MTVIYYPQHEWMARADLRDQSLRAKSLSERRNVLCRERRGIVHMV
jgi:hypothetical protein